MRPEIVGVGDAAREHQRVVVLGARVADGAVDRKAIGLVEVVERLCLTGLRGEQLDDRASLLERLARLGQLDLLDAFVGDRIATFLPFRMSAIAGVPPRDSGSVICG
jgi:hypothetical protein